MSNFNNEILAEGFADEYFDDPSAADDWLVDVCDQDIDGLTEDEKCELFVELSMEMME